MDIASDFEEAEELNEQNDYSVGLIYFEYFADAESVKQYDRLLLNGNNTLWIALLSENGKKNNQVCGLIKHRFYDFHTLPVDIERLIITLGHAYGIAQLKCGISPRETGEDNEFGIIGSSPATQKLLRMTHKASLVEAPVFIHGETGSGKELVAYAIHRQSARFDAPFIAVNCGSIPSTLIQSELFGYEKGAFTGANHRKIGRIEAAAGGTVFFDEIGDLPLDLQINLLRFLQEKTIDRVGSNQSIEVDARVIAATHVDIEKAVAQGRFREDLYYRLNVIQIHVPPLRERGTDIELLAQYFFDKYAQEKDPRVQGFSQGAFDAMYQYYWPGNVRELINRIRQALVMSDNRLITAKDLRLSKTSSVNKLQSLTAARRAAEKKAIETALRFSNYNISLAANMLDISRSTLYRLMEKYSLL